MNNDAIRWPLPSGLEPGCDHPRLTGQEAALASIAISLKRIADTIDPALNTAATRDRRAAGAESAARSAGGEG